MHRRSANSKSILPIEQASVRAAVIHPTNKLTVNPSATSHRPRPGLSCDRQTDLDATIGQCAVSHRNRASMRYSHQTQDSVRRWGQGQSALVATACFVLLLYDSVGKWLEALPRVPSRGGGGSSLSRIFRRIFDHSFPACAFVVVEVELSSRTLIPFFRPGSVHSGSES